jgi:hypothetical protein
MNCRQNGVANPLLAATIFNYNCLGALRQFCETPGSNSKFAVNEFTAWYGKPAEASSSCQTGISMPGGGCADNACSHQTPSTILPATTADRGCGELLRLQQVVNPRKSAQSATSAVYRA